MSDFFVSKLGKNGSENTLDWSRLLATGPARAPASWSIPEAFVAILLNAVTCDGEMAAVEYEELLALAHRSRALKSLSPQQLGDINVTVAERLRAEPDALAHACAALPEEMRLSAFAHALDLILADGELKREEADFLNTLILRLGLARDDVERVASVISIKNLY